MKGSCLCGAVKYTLSGEPLGINCCHCRQCRKASGTAFATNAAYREADFRVREGEDVIAGYASTPGKTRHFCSRCGSPLYSASVHAPGVVYVRIGTVDDDARLSPDVHIHVSNKAPWYRILDALPQRREEEDLWF